MFVLYVTVLIALVFLGARLWGLSAVVGANNVVALGVIISLVAYLAMLLPAVLGVLRPPIVVVVLLIVVWVISALTRRTITELGQMNRGGLPTPDGFRRVELIGVLAAALLVLVLLGRDFLILGAMCFNPQIWLNWDVVGYHLPGLAEFFREQSLWTLAGPYQSYSFGFEFIYGLPLLFVRGHWSLPIIYMLSALLLFAGMWDFSRVLLAACKANELLPRLTAFLFSLAVWGWLFADKLSIVGKNDIFLTACFVVTASVSLDLLLVGGKLDRRAVWGRLALATASACLAVATKSTSLAVMPVLVGVLSYAVVKAGPNREENWGRKVITAITLFLSGSLVFGGAFLIRNVTMIGSVIDPAHKGYFGLSLAAHAGDARLLVPTTESTSMCLVIVAAASSLVWLRRRLTWANRRSVQLVLAAVLAAGFAGVAVTPHFFLIRPAAYHGLAWDIRLAMPLLTMCALIVASTGALVIRSIDSRTIDLPARVSGAVAAAASLASKLSRKLPIAALVLGLAIPLLWAAQPTKGLPGWESPKSGGHTEIYSWIQDQPDTLRIYSIGLIPYGLLGRGWNNWVFSDISTAAFMSEDVGIKRVKSILQGFQPNLIIVSAMLDPAGVPRVRPVTYWLSSHRDLVVEVFRDSMVVAYAVKGMPGEALGPPASELLPRMAGF